MPFHSKWALLWRVNVAGKNRKYLGLHVRCPIFLPNFNQICIFSTDFYKSPPISDFTEFRPVGTALTHGDRRTDTTKLTGAFHGNANAPNMEKRHFMCPRSNKFPSRKDRDTSCLMRCSLLTPFHFTVGWGLERHKPITYNYTKTEAFDVETRNEDGALPIVG
jgi:hypothetical protein